jgi:hypothetical protein
MVDRDPNWDPGVKRYFVKILNSVALGLIWMLAAATAGIYFELAWKGSKPIIYTILYYMGLAVSLFFLLRYYHKHWKDPERF